MTPDELRLDEGHRWLRQASKDLTSAVALVPVEASRSLFLSQQAAEKAAKAFLAVHNVVFRKTHNLEELGGQCTRLDPTLKPYFDGVSGLTLYAVTFRYLDPPVEPDEQEALRGLEAARALVAEVTLGLSNK